MNPFICSGRSSLPFLRTRKRFSTSVREHNRVQGRNTTNARYIPSSIWDVFSRCAQRVKVLIFLCSSDSFQTSSSLILPASPDKRHLCLLRKMDYTNRKITLQTSPTSKNKRCHGASRLCRFILLPAYVINSIRASTNKHKNPCRAN